MKVFVLTKKEWLEVMPIAHSAVFNTNRPQVAERCDYVIVCDIDGKPAGWVTVHAINEQDVYWQFGGAMPVFKTTMQVAKGYDLMLAQQAKVAKRIYTKISNSNYRMLKLAMSRGFKIVGVRHHNDETLVELVKEFA